jgi:hypothetical protein
MAEVGIHDGIFFRQCTINRVASLKRIHFMPWFAVRLIVCLERFNKATTMPESHLLAPLSHLSGPFKEHDLLINFGRAPAAELLRLLLFLAIHHLRFDFFQP